MTLLPYSTQSQNNEIFSSKLGSDELAGGLTTTTNNIKMYKRLGVASLKKNKSNSTNRILKIEDI